MHKTCNILNYFTFFGQQSKDGIFWISWQDCQIHFPFIYVCRIYSPEMCYSVHEKWCGYSAWGCQDYESWHQNPKFRLRATGPEASIPIHVFLTLKHVYIHVDIYDWLSSASYCRPYLINLLFFWKHFCQSVGFSRKSNGFRKFQSSHCSALFYIGLRKLKIRIRFYLSMTMYRE